jgi:cyanophycinase
MKRGSFAALFVVVALAVGSARADQRLILVGGGDRPLDAMQRFVDWAGGHDAKLLIISWATEYPAESLAYFHEQIDPLHPASIEQAPTQPLTAESRATFLAQLARATGVFFTGGDQARIMDVLEDRSLADALRARYEAGIVFGGTSAGTAIMSQMMITGNGDFTVIDASKVEVRPGLGLLRGVIVDQHFIARQRENRLFGLLLAHRDELGVGIDEDTALVVTEGRYAEVVGASHVMIVDPAERDGALVVMLLSPGNRYDLRTRRQLSAEPHGKSSTRKGKAE